MTKLFFIATWLITLLCSCQSETNNHWKDFIPGVYATSYNHSYSVGKDTIQIILNQRSGSNMYAIIRRNSYQRMINGELKPAVAKQFVWAGVADDELHALVVLKNKRMIVFEPESNQLQLGTTIYKKIK